MTLLERVGLGAIVGVVLLIGLESMSHQREAPEPQPQVSIRCEAKGDGSGNCRVENKGTVSADVDVNVVAVCRDGEHVAHVSARVEAQNHATKIIDSFEPSIGLSTSCAGVDFRDMLVRKTT